MINFYNIDNMQFMRQKSDKHYDLAIVDPPYGMVGNTFYSTSKQFIKDGYKCAQLDGGDLCKFTLGERPDVKYWNELFRVSKNQIVFGMQYFTTYLPPHQCVIVWDKMNGESRFSDAEILWTSFDLGTRIIKEYNKPNGRIHPTQKPVKLYRKILQKFAIKGQKILDTHGGSMNIAIACDMEGFDLDVCELKKEYFTAGVHQYKNFKQQMTIF